MILDKIIGNNIIDKGRIETGLRTHKTYVAYVILTAVL